MKFTLCKIEPRGSFHLGTKEGILEETSDYIHSDTLFSAICNSYRLLYGNEELENVLEQFKDGDPPFLISSAFPFVKDTLLFPLPKNVDFGEYVEERKEFKKVEFVSKTIFDRILESKDIKEDAKKENLIQRRALLTNEEKAKIGKIKEIWHEQEVPRVAIDRKTSASSICHFGEVIYSNECGMYFLINFKKKECEREVKAAIRLLGDEGIGGDRTYGKGLFKIKEPEFDRISMDLQPKNGFVTLSLYYPKKDEVPKLKGGYYELIGRGGWVYSLNARNIRRRFVRMFIEGSVFNVPTGLYGDLVPVGPEEFTDHEIYRYGYAFTIPIEVKR
jgi:CRISPR-associated protein Csm4